MKEKVITYLKKLGFETISHDSSKIQIFHNKDTIVTVEEKVNNKLKIGDVLV